MTDAAALFEGALPTGHGAGGAPRSLPRWAHRGHDEVRSGEGLEEALDWLAAPDDARRRAPRFAHVHLPAKPPSAALRQDGPPGVRDPERDRRGAGRRGGGRSGRTRSARGARSSSPGRPGCPRRAFRRSTASLQFTEGSWADLNIRGFDRFRRLYFEPYVPLWFMALAAAVLWFE